MKKARLMLTMFAVFASILMLTTTCLARPVQEKTNIENVECAQQRLLDALKIFYNDKETDKKITPAIGGIIGWILQLIQDILSIIGSMVKIATDIISLIRSIFQFIKDLFGGPNKEDSQSAVV